MIENVTPERCIEFAIRTEEIGAQMYTDLAARFGSDRELRELFASLAQDEVDHGDRFRALQDRLVPRLRDRPASAEQGEYLRAMSMSEVFDSEALSKSVGGIRSREDALERALALEKATLAYYQAMRDILGPDEFLDTLIGVEKKHVVKVMQLLVTGAKFRGLADTF
jgi:rubrerythrin